MRKQHAHSDVSTLRTTNDDPSCEATRRILELHPMSSVAELDREPKANCVSVDSSNQDRDRACATQLDLEDEKAWRVPVNAQRRDPHEPRAWRQPWVQLEEWTLERL